MRTRSRGPPGTTAGAQDTVGPTMDTPWASPCRVRATFRCPADPKVTAEARTRCRRAPADRCTELASADREPLNLVHVSGCVCVRACVRAEDRSLAKSPQGCALQTRGRAQPTYGRSMRSKSGLVKVQGHNDAPNGEGDAARRPPRVGGLGGRNAVAKRVTRHTNTKTTCVRLHTHPWT